MEKTQHKKPEAFALQMPSLINGAPPRRVKIRQMTDEELAQARRNMESEVHRLELLFRQIETQLHANRAFASVVIYECERREAEREQKPANDG